MACPARAGCALAGLPFALIGSLACSPAPVHYDGDLLVAGSAFRGVHGLAFDAEDRLYAGSVVGQAIYRVDPASGAVETVIGPPAGMADDLELGPDGELVWTSFLLGLVHARRGEGQPIEVLASGLPGINSLAFRPDGRLFATQVFLGDALYEIDRRGAAPPRLIVEGMGGLNGFDFGPDGRLYGPLWFRGEVVRVDVDSGQLETVASGFKTPAAANFDSQGRLFVLDTASGEVLAVDTESGNKRVVAVVASGLDNLAIDSRDRLFVSNFCDNGIYEVDLATGAVRTVVAGELAVPGGLAVHAAGDVETLYVADTFAYRTVDLATGAVTDVRRMFERGLEELDYPSAVAVSDDHVLLTSWFSGTVQKLARASQTTLAMMHGFNAPAAALDLGDGRVLVAELGSGRLVVAGGAAGEERATVLEGLAQPVHLARSPAGEVYVSDSAAGSIGRVDLASGEKTTVVDGLEAPEGFAFLSAERLLVAEVGGGRLVGIDLTSGSRWLELPIAVGLPAPAGLPPSFIPTGVAVGADGRIYVSSDRLSAIHRFRPRD